MKLIMLTYTALLLAIVLILGAMAQNETLPALMARDLPPVELLTGPDFKVDDVVPTDGFYGIFTVRGAYGSRSAGITPCPARQREFR